MEKIRFYPFVSIISSTFAIAVILGINGLSIQSAAAQPKLINPDLLNGDWPAYWISHPTDSRTEFGVYHFRREFELNEKPSSFVIHVSADNRYRLFVNGQAVSMGPERGDLKNWHFETVDIAPLLVQGENVLAAVVWNFARYRPVAQVSYETAFLVQGNTEKESVVNTDEQWRVVRNDAYEPIPVDRRALGNYYVVVGPGEQVNAKEYPWGWMQVGFDDDSWLSALTLRRAVPKWGHHHDIYMAWQLVPRQIPPMEERRESNPVIDRAEGIQATDAFINGTGALQIPASTHATILLDQQQLTTAYPELLASGGADSRITLTYAEALLDEQGQKGNRNEIEGKRIVGYSDVFIMDGGDQRLFRPLWFRTFRYLQIEIETADEPLLLEDFHSMFSAYPFEERASFSGSDRTLQDIWNVGWRTARLCAGETYFDCPYYEQLQYVGDTRIQALISLYVAGDDRLMRKAILEFHNSRDPDGLTQSRYPVWEPQFIPPYSLFWIVMVHDYWMHRDDPEFVEQFLTGIRGVIDWYEAYVDDTGMLGPMPWWNFVDWSYPRGVPPGADDGHSSVVSLQFVYALDRAAELADAFGRTGEAEHYRTLSNKVRDGVYEHCWDDGRNLLADSPEKQVFSQHANVMAVLVDMFTRERELEVMNRVIYDTSLVQCTYYYRFYVTQAMKKAGLGDFYVERLDPWRQMLALGLTTFAEEPDPTRSDCHAWSSSPNYDFLATVCGIRPASAGFSTVRIEPNLGTLEWVSGKMPHPRGEIHVHFERTDSGGIVGEITLPEGVKGDFIWQDRSIELVGGTQAIEL